jgi:hypothetical protein
MPLISDNYLRNLARLQTNTERVTMFSATKERTSFDIFLSHSFLDKEAVRGLFIELTRLGYSVYVDWIVDPHLDRENVTKASAELIRLRLQSCKSLLLAVSHNADLSKWIPWELGYLDGHKHRCALLPVSKSHENNHIFQRREYLLLYPYIKKVNNTSGEEKLWVTESGHRYIIFDDWIKGNAIFERQTDITYL